jgi:hypothetical protein
MQMLTKKVLKKEASAIFIAIVLVLGTIALTLPSFSVEAQATKIRDNDYENDDQEKKSYDKDDYKSEYTSYGKYEDRDHDKYNKDSSSSVSIKKVKCNNINVNLNGIDVNIGGLPNNGPVTGPMALAQEEADDNELESNSIENDNDGRDGHSDYDKDSIVCINNNNNIVVGEPKLTCEECFTKNLNDEELENLIQILILIDLDDLDGLCEALSDPTISNQEKILGIVSLLTASGVNDEDTIRDILECLEDLQLVILPGELPIPSIPER